MVTVKVRLFGRFRNFHREPFLTLQIPRDAPLDALKDSLAVALQTSSPDFDARSLDDVAFADEDAILAPDIRFSNDCELAVLPPVCGG